MEAKTHVSNELSNLGSFLRRHTYAKKQRWLGNSEAFWVAARLVRKEKLINRYLGRWLGLRHGHAQPKGKGNCLFQQGCKPGVKVA